MKDIAQKRKTQEVQKVFVPNYTSEREIQKKREEQRKQSQSTKNLSFSSIKPKNKNIFEKSQVEYILNSQSIIKNKQVGELIQNASQEVENKQQASFITLKIESLQDQLKEKSALNNLQSLSKNSSKNFQDASVSQIIHILDQGKLHQQYKVQTNSDNSQIPTQFQKHNEDTKKYINQISEQKTDNSNEEGQLSQQNDNNKPFVDESKIEEEEDNKDKQESALKSLYSFQYSGIDIQCLEKILKQRTKISEKTILSQNGNQFEKLDAKNTENNKTSEPLQYYKREIQKENQNKVPFTFKIRPKNQVNKTIQKQKINFSALIDKIFEKSSASKIEGQIKKENQEEKISKEESAINNNNLTDQTLNYIQQNENMTQIQVKYQNKDLVIKLLSIDVFLSDSNKQDTLVFIVVQDVWQDLYLKKVEDIQKDKFKLFATLSHELRTPLNCSISMLEVLKDELSQKENNKFCIEEYINPALFSNKLLLNQINDILDYVQMDCGKFKYSFFDFNIVNLLRDCGKLVSMQAKMKNIQLLLAFDSKINQEICSDPNRIRQIILNFLSNSLKFTKSGGHIELGYQQISKDIYKIYVKDSGIGITLENQQKIFGFCNKIKYQSKEEEQLNYQGCGLGLTISNQLAEGLITSDNFKGGISVESEYGVGSIFSILVEDLNHFYQNTQQSKLNSLKQINQRKSIKSSQNRIDYQRNSIKNVQYLKLNSNISQINEQNAEQSVVTTKGNDELENSQIEELNKSLHPFIQGNDLFAFDKSQKCLDKYEMNNLKNLEINSDNLKSIFQENIQIASSSQIIDDATNQDYRLTINRPFYIQQNRKFQEEEMYDFKNNQLQNCIALKLQPCSVPFKSQNSKYTQKIFEQSNNNKLEQTILKNNSYKQITNQNSNQDLQNQINKKSSSLIQDNIQQLYENTQITIENMVDSEIKKMGSETSYLNKKTSTQGSLQNWTQRKSISIFKQKQESREENICNEQEGFNSYAVNKQIEGSRLSTSKITSSSLINEKQSKMICFFKSNLTSNKSTTEVDNMIDINKNDILIPTSQQFLEEVLEFNINKKKKCQCPQIMIVDDNQFNLYALQKIIQQFQFNLTTLSDGDQAIEAIKNQYYENCCPSPNMILMDIEMPIKNGYETVKEIIQFYKTEQYKSIPVIVACTAYVGQEDYEKSIESGMDDFINKPILKMAFKNLIQNYRYQFFNRY
ncbi:ATPase, histidine kinase-, DNA gyrase B (macronuclear) [Tetrahymena thermophila SB210]|uniref:histidine kinase n=1 Tax=Tetrahymena thermophila (strain SB210) TaxID=312017 RepID=Q23EC9_TETTS|nr:ATPase, histidine kinase-, DNA gyrase B [Tetrahymena thermophila SB210]EAR94824.2 ATPase, histidine kinase-, DNA gyrase B [Tetrahymena thermophila SB210]|eukprot:XP_001015069.2 ATPase, histidine kinase-, DNA gyrase B [Tetrahymena thermophila SB210]